jgi:glycine dehydrogenase subunit 1
LDGHRYLPTGPEERREMLDRIGVDGVEELFSSLPDAVRLSEPPAVAGPLGDQELRRYFGALQARNMTPGSGAVSFLGAGAYRHDGPAAVDHLLPLPTRDEPGHAAGDLRVSDPDLDAHRPAGCQRFAL